MVRRERILIVILMLNLILLYQFSINNVYATNVRYVYLFEIDEVKPVKVAYDAKNDRIIVADEDNRILIYDKDGRLIKQLDSMVTDSDSIINRRGLDYDNDNDRLLVIGSVPFTPKGKSVVNVAGVNVLDREGNILFNFSVVKNHDTYALVIPHQIAYDHNHDRVIAVGIDPEVYIFDDNGNLMHKFRIPKYGSEQYMYAGAILPTARLIRVWDVVYDHNNDRIIVADTWIPGYSNVQILNNSGDRVLRLVPPSREEFEPVTSVAYDHNHDRVIVADASNKIYIFDRDGRFMTEFGSKGNKILEFNNILDITYDPNNDRILVADYGNDRVQVLGLVGGVGTVKIHHQQYYTSLLMILIFVAAGAIAVQTIVYLKRRGYLLGKLSIRR